MKLIPIYMFHIFTQKNSLFLGVFQVRHREQTFTQLIQVLDMLEKTSKE